MKTKKLQKRILKSIMFLILLIFISIPIASISQNVQLDANLKSITSFKGKFVDGKVYLKVTVNGIKEDTYFFVERSIDGTSYQKIASIKENDKRIVAVGTKNLWFFTKLQSIVLLYR